MASNWNRTGKEMPEQVRVKISNSLKGKIRSEDFKKLRSKIMKTKWQEKAYREQMVDKHRGHKKSEETKKKISLILKGRGLGFKKGHKLSKESIQRIIFANKNISSETRKKMSLARKGIIVSEKTKSLMSDIMKQKWKNPEYKTKLIRSQLKGLAKRPTSIEKQVIEIIKKHSLPYKYTGDGDFLIGFRNPDFINTNGEKICIETRPRRMCKYWNKCSPEEYRDNKLEHYAKFGWKCIVLFADRKFDENYVLESLRLMKG